MTKTTLLFLNAGRRVELIQTFRKALDEVGVVGRIITTDIHNFAPALYVGDKHYILPHSTSSCFLDELCHLCASESVNLIIPLIDPDLPVLARNRQVIESTGVRVLVSGQWSVDTCLDKKSTFAFLQKNRIPTPQILDIDQARHWGYPLFIKPRKGSASVNAYRINNRDELEFFKQFVPDAVIQEFIKGYEITTDVFSDWSGEPITAVPRRRLRVRAGEVIVGRVERNDKLEQVCKYVARSLGTVGAINIQAIRSESAFFITEINPRLGGGCTLSMAAGAPLAKWMILMALGRPIPLTSVRLKDGLTMMRFEESIFYSPEALGL